jgi:hypothetical protein
MRINGACVMFVTIPSRKTPAAGKMTMTIAKNHSKKVRSSFLMLKVISPD